MECCVHLPRLAGPKRVGLESYARRDLAGGRGFGKPLMQHCPACGSWASMYVEEVVGAAWGFDEGVSSATQRAGSLIQEFKWKIAQ
jgi:hypothetical protein